MFIYIIQISLLLFVGLFTNPYRKDSLKTYKLLFFVLSFFVMAFRDLSVGVDTLSYSFIYQEISSRTFSQLLYSNIYQHEILFKLLVKLSSVIYDSYFFYQTVISFLICFGIIRFLEKSSKDFVFTSLIILCCGLYLSAFNITRQMLAVVLLLNGWIFLLEHKHVKAWGVWVIATQIHLSSVIFIVAYILYYLVVFLKRKWIVYLMPIVVALFYYFFFQIIELFGSEFDMYSNYLKNKKEIITAGGIVVIWSIVLLVSLYVLYVSGRKTNVITKTAAVLSLAYVASKLIGLEFNYFDRIGAYFMAFIIVVFEAATDCINSRPFSKLFKYSILFLYVIYYCLSVTSEQYQYNFYF